MTKYRIIEEEWTDGLRYFVQIRTLGVFWFYLVDYYTGVRDTFKSIESAEYWIRNSAQPRFMGKRVVREYPQYIKLSIDIDDVVYKDALCVCKKEGISLETFVERGLETYVKKQMTSRKLP